MTFCDGGIANNSVHIEETDVLDQDLASPKDGDNIGVAEGNHAKTANQR